MTTQSLAGQLTSFTLTMTTMVCGECGIPFAVPQNYYNKLRETHETWHCPNGHERHYSGENEKEKLQRMLKEKENELMRKTTQNIQLDNQLTKIKKDISAGKCPCCGKQYKHLANHMARKHPKGR